MIEWIKKEWKNKGCFYRTVRTFLQAAGGVILAGIMALITKQIGFEWNSIMSGILIPALSAGIGAVMNKSKKEMETNE